MTSHPPDRFLDEAKSMACVHCGLCLGSCPTYLETGNENDSPRGRIHLMRAIQDGRMALTAEPVRHLDLCLGCRACETACPSGVAYGSLLEQARHHVGLTHDRPMKEDLLRRFVIEGLFPHPERLEIALRPAEWIHEAGLESLLPDKLRGMLDLLTGATGGCSLPSYSVSQAVLRKGVVGLLNGCVMRVLFGRTHKSTITLLNAAGWDVCIPQEQGCCGALHAHGGGMEQAREAAKKMIRVFEESGVEHVVTNAAGCGSMMKEYGDLFSGDPAWAERARRFCGKVRDLSELLDPSLFLEGGWTGGHVTYHDACHLAHAQRITTGPRRLVKRVAGSSYVELAEADLCCGSAGSYNLTEPEMAERLMKRKCGNVAATGAAVVVTANPGCQLQIQAGLAHQVGSPVKVMHLADFLADALPGSARPALASSSIRRETC